MKFNCVSGRPSFQFANGFSSCRPKRRFAVAVRLTVMLTRGVWRAIPGRLGTGSAEVTMPLAIRPTPPSFSLANTSTVSPAAMCLPPYIVLCSRKLNWSARGSVTSALMANMRRSSEPVVGDTAAVARQVLELVESVEMVDRYRGHLCRLRQPQVHGDAPTAFRVVLLRAPEGHATAPRTEMELERLASGEGLRRTRDADAFVLIVVRPQHAVATARGAIAGGRAVRLALECPSNRAAEAGSLDHVRASFPVSWRPDPASRLRLGSASR